MDGGLRRRRLLQLIGAGLGLQAALPAGAGQATPLHQAAGMTPRAARGLMTRVLRAGERLVALGERGLVVLSDDGGRQWRQAHVPVSVTLTSASFVDARQGWIAGHGGVILHTGDGGETWALQTDGIALANAALAQAHGLSAAATQRAQRLVDEGADKPLLSICFADARRGMAVGAYGLATSTRDGGKTWHPCTEGLPNPQGLHLYAAARHGKTWVLAGEQGLLMRSVDDGASFEPLAAPSRRSFFTATATRDGAFVCAGLLGNACRVEGPTPTPLALPAPLTLLSCTEGRDGRLLLLAQGGRLLVSRDGGSSFTEQPLPRLMPLTALAEAPDGGLVATSLGGVARLG
ncbi:YCF48-related protein [Pelomonas sp. KK5]|uniref:YCF48-related protein n=1 Tax=Pelomonas sp. KK5 TaxID=1855730 RepID=UPI00097BF4CC|nr:YCF48-related protein [Pelomonas sp. KK5]